MDYVMKQQKDELAGCFIFRADHILVREGEGLIFPQVRSPEDLGIDSLCRYELPANGVGRWAAAAVAESVNPPNGYSFVRLRSLFGNAPDELFWAAGHGYQIMEWDRTTRFCGSCGAQTEHRAEELVAVCTACGYEQYPRVSPAMICAVVRDGQILLAQNARYRGGRYSVLAGFVESGESLEECVAREVMEETGISVRDVEYFGSQPWPFPHNLMVGFTAKWDSGEVKADERELVDAGWYAPDALPELLPPPPTIARALIDWFVRTHR
jgi:NAD+ diphosphatase